MWIETNDCGSIVEGGGASEQGTKGGFIGKWWRRKEQWDATGDERQITGQLDEGTIKGGGVGDMMETRKALAGAERKEGEGKRREVKEEKIIAFVITLF